MMRRATGLWFLVDASVLRSHDEFIELVGPEFADEVVEHPIPTNGDRLWGTFRCAVRTAPPAKHGHGELVHDEAHALFCVEELRGEGPSLCLEDLCLPHLCLRDPSVIYRPKILGEALAEVEVVESRPLDSNPGEEPRGVNCARAPTGRVT